MRLFGLGLVAGAAALAACPETTPAPGDGGSDDWCPDTGGLTVDEYCQRQAEVYCDGWAACCDLEDRAACIAWMLDECEAGEISSVRAGHSCLDGAVAERCMSAYERSFDDCERDESFSEACRFRWYGDAGPGEGCRDVWHCQRGLGCVLQGTTGTCVELPEGGESCGDYGVCQPGYYCSYEDWICHSDPGIGERCERDDVCGAGRCVEGTCQAVPWCE